MNKMTYWKILAPICFILLLFGMTIEHEETHEEIFEAYGVDSNITYGLFSGVTTPNITDVMRLSNEEYRDMNILHSINELVSYQFTAFACFIFIIFYLIVIILYLEARP